MSRTDGAFEASEKTDGRGTTVVDTPPRPLADLAPGARARVIRIVTDGEPAVVRRLHDLGFSPGTVVEVVRRAPLRDPVLYRVRDYEVCLRRAQARCVLVGEAQR
ncbi:MULTISPECIES: ferrous iron transport protein A [unclassified Streptomyces]|uniref:FeoA family protein n=1 Tax=unclassified Streptomyces TaxID=2593676 RepID=UPI000F6E5FFA|nr:MULTISPECIES: FeoA family protein [unclassified Streptomyces]AZM59135.1 ferrous iron transport protein A [Streptomyces sp. WAC 01438]RSM96755.1 ferrous iron transport protein A [Streptomyces sp. WAC 01420]